jgi:hypothetical protein
LNPFVLFGNRSNLKMVPTTFFEHTPDQIVLVKALHNQHEGAVHFGVEARLQGGILPVTPALLNRDLSRHGIPDQGFKILPTFGPTLGVTRLAWLEP